MYKFIKDMFTCQQSIYLWYPSKITANQAEKINKLIKVGYIIHIHGGK